MRRQIELGPELFRFESLGEWKGLGGNPWIRNGVNIHNAVTIDARGRLCPTGAQFRRAELEGAYPVVVYNVEPEEQPDACDSCGDPLPELTPEELAALPECMPALCDRCLHYEGRELERAREGSRG